MKQERLQRTRCVRIRFLQAVAAALTAVCGLPQAYGVASDNPAASELSSVWSLQPSASDSEAHRQQVERLGKPPAARSQVGISAVSKQTLDDVLSEAEERARARAEQSRAEAAVEAQRRAQRKRAEGSMFGEAPSIVRAPDRSISEAPSASSQGAVSPQAGRAEVLRDGRVRMHMRLGKFGPEASIVAQPVVIAPRKPNRIVRYTESGMPVSERRDRLITFSKALAAQWKKEINRKIAAGELPPLPKRKTQAEIWAEKNAEVLERRKKYGRETSKNFVIAGTTPEQSKLYYRDSTYLTMVDGKPVPVVDAPQDQLPAGWLSKDEYEKAKRKPSAVQISSGVRAVGKTEPKRADAEAETSGMSETVVFQPNQFADWHSSAESERQDEAAIRSFFPDIDRRFKDSVRNGSKRRAIDEEAEKAEETELHRAFPDKTSCNASRSQPMPLQANLIVRILDRMLGLACSTAQAAEEDASEEADEADEADEAEAGAAAMRTESSAAAPSPVRNKALQAFDGIAKEIAEGRKAIEQRVNAADAERRARRAADDAAEAAGSCLQCRLSGAEAADRAAKFVGSRPSAELFGSRSFYGIDEEGEAPFEQAGTPEERAVSAAALAVPEEMQTLDRKADKNAEKALEDIVNLMGDPSHPASLIASLRRGLEENPVVLDYVSDAAERLGLISSEQSQAARDPLGTGTLIFISFSLGEAELKDLFARNAGKADATLVFRGIPDGMNFAEGVKRIQGLASQFNPMPNVVIDPTLFRDYAVRAVPTVIRVRETPDRVRVRKPGEKRRQVGEMLAKAEGLHSDAWVKEQMEAGHTGDLGQQGEVREIKERDLIEVAKERVMQIDWDAKKERAAKFAWAHLQYQHLPTAARTATRYIDPTILVEKDILDLNGNPIRKAGDRVNPMDIRAFTLALVVFNPLVESEVRTVEAELPKLRAEHPQVMLLATDMVKDETGWDAYVKLTDRLDSHVFLLTPEVRERFELRATPSIVTGDNDQKVFMVKEIAPSQAER